MLGIGPHSSNFHGHICRQSSRLVETRSLGTGSGDFLGDDC